MRGVFLLSIGAFPSARAEVVLAENDAAAAVEITEEAPPFVLERESVAPPLKDGRRVIFRSGAPAPVAPKQPVAADVATAVSRSSGVFPPSGLPPKTRLLSLTVTQYPEGWTLLSWWEPPAERGGAGHTREAWSRADFSGVWLSQDFDNLDTRWLVFPVLLPAGKHSRPLPAEVRALPAAADGFVPAGGASADDPALAPLLALHRIHSEEGPALAEQWRAIQAKHAAEAEHRRLHPPPLEDIVISVRPGRSNLRPAPPKPDNQ